MQRLAETQGTLAIPLPYRSTNKLTINSGVGSAVDPQNAGRGGDRGSIGGGGGGGGAEREVPENQGHK